jgi:peptidoglycan/LPS O-acetylase OafA/YrhL
MNRSLSLYLDLVRVFAALVVLTTHLAYRELSGGMLAPWRLVGNDAVMIFFVLSGYVIAYVRDTKEHDVADYAASRLARLWSVAVPALLLTLLLDAWGRTLDPAAYVAWWAPADQPLWRIWSAFTFTNELWFASVRPFSNGPWWSLGYEAVYYALFAAITFWTGMRRRLIVAALCLLAGPKILLLFPIWWLGVLVYRRNKAGPVAPGTGLFLFAGSIAAYAALRWAGIPVLLLDATRATLGSANVGHYLHFSDEFIASYLIGPLVAANFIGAYSLSARIGSWLSPVEVPLRWFAQFTFAIYLVHYPLLRFIAAAVPYDRQSPLHVAAVFAATVAGCVAAGLLTEPLKPWLKARLMLLVRRTVPQPAMQAA